VGVTWHLNVGAPDTGPAVRVGLPSDCCGSLGAKLANADANNHRGRSWTAVGARPAMDGPEQAPDMNVDGCGRSSFHS
jgi:hypothetical protein